MASRLGAAIRRSAVLAAALSFIWPGLGQGWAGARRRALLFAAPMVLLGVAALLVVIAQGKARAFGLLLQPDVLLGLFALNLVVLAYRAFAIVDAYRVANRRWPPPVRGQAAIGALLLGVVLGGTLLMHGWLGLVAYKSYDTIVAVFHTSEPTPSAAPTPTLLPGETPGPTPSRRRSPPRSRSGRTTGASTCC